jgi:predicted dinucleotide-binding enzyme
MTAVTIIGAGGLGGAVAGLAAKAGADLQVLARDPEKAAAVASPLNGQGGRIGDRITGDIVVIALPYPAVEGVLGNYADALAGRTVVDVTNPLDFETFDALVVPADSSAAAIIQQQIPEAHVVKAFNVNFGGTLTSGKAGAVTTTVLAAGDDDAAKKSVLDLVEAAGLRGVDAGSLKRARELEAVGFLQLTLAAAGKTSWNGGFALVD